MKNNLITALSLSLLLAASAYGGGGPETAEVTAAGQRLTGQELRNVECVALGKTAEQVMEARQQGLSLADMISRMPGARRVVMLAYEEPRENSPAERKRAVATFGQQLTVACYKMNAATYLNFGSSSLL